MTPTPESPYEYDQPERSDVTTDANEDTSAIRAEIETTRVRMSQTLDEIGERLNPHNIKENVKDSIKEATIGRVSHMARNAANSVSRTTNGMTNTVRENPIPAAMVAIGLGWMIWNSRSSHDAVTSYRSAYDVGYGDDYGQEYGREGSRDMASAARQKIERAERGVQQMASNVKERASELTDNVKDRAQGFASTVSETTRRGKGRVEDAFEANPLVLGAVAMAAGLAAGFSAPVTDREVRLMGGARDDLVDRVKDVAEDTKEKAQRVASHVEEDAKTAAREEGLSLS